MIETIAFNEALFNYWDSDAILEINKEYYEPDKKENVKNGEILTKKNIRRIRPGYGLAPKFFDEVIGKKAKIDIEKGTALDWSLIDLSI